MMAITTSSSINVNPDRRVALILFLRLLELRIEKTTL
jgi:hypothetical protein